MEDFIQILIYLFIIISFLASMFKKKEKPGSNKPETVYKPSQQPKVETSTSSSEEYDILKEIERMFKTEIPSKQKPEDVRLDTETTPSQYEHVKTDDWHQPSPLEHGKTISEHTAENWEDTRIKAEEKRKVIDQKILKQAEMFEKRMKQKVSYESYYTSSIYQKLKKPASLKEYIIISEIIGKPKALQE
jgi:hypothetical protein